MATAKTKGLQGDLASARQSLDTLQLAHEDLTLAVGFMLKEVPVPPAEGALSLASRLIVAAGKAKEMIT